MKTQAEACWNKIERPEQKMELEMIKLLSDQGRPLEITLEEKDGITLVTRDGETAEFKSDRPDSIRKHLAFYPREVTINGERLETKPWQGLGYVKSIEPRSRNIDHQNSGSLTGTGTTPPPWLNAYVGGLNVRLGHIEKKFESSYFSLMPQQTHRHHRLLRTISVKTFLEIQEDEIDLLAQNQFGLFLEDGSELEGRVLGRRREMLNRTMAQPDMPQPYTGTVYACALTGEQGAEHFYKPAPIAVAGIPIVIEQDQDEMSNAEFVTVVETLYENDAELVPVSQYGSSAAGVQIEAAGPEVLRTRSIEFEFTQGNQEHETWMEAITMRVTMQDDRTMEMPTRLHMEGHSIHEAKVAILPGSTTRDEIAEMMFAGYWTQDDWGSWEDMKLAAEWLEERIQNMVTHIQGDTTTAVRNEMQQAVDRFHSFVPLPNSGTITVQGQDGKLELTLNPQG